MDLERRRELLEFALTLADTAQAEILPHYQRCAADLKADGTEVTLADRAAELAIREAIAQRYPEHAVLGEEFGGERDAAQQWIVDPLDGTSAFALGLPLFGTLIAYAEHGEPVIGTIHFPVLGETVYAARGLGCWFRNRDGDTVRIRARPPTALSDAIVSASGVHASDIQPERDGRAYALTALIRQAKKFRVCGDCLQHALVCRGSLHVAIDTIMQPWDIAALVPCIEEAGGACAAIDGRREGVVFSGSLVAACDQALLDEVIGILNPRGIGAAERPMNFRALPADQRDALLAALRYWLAHWDAECPTLFGVGHAELEALVSTWPEVRPGGELSAALALNGALRELLYGASAVPEAALTSLIGLTCEQAGALCERLHAIVGSHFAAAAEERATNAAKSPDR